MYQRSNSADTSTNDYFLDSGHTLAPRFTACSKSQPCRVAHPVKRRAFVLRLVFRMWLGADSWDEVHLTTMRGPSLGAQYKCSYLH